MVARLIMQNEVSINKKLIAGLMQAMELEAVVSEAKLCEPGEGHKMIPRRNSQWFEFHNYQGPRCNDDLSCLRATLPTTARVPKKSILAHSLFSWFPASVKSEGTVGLEGVAAFHRKVFADIRHLPILSLLSGA